MNTVAYNDTQTKAYTVTIIAHGEVVNWFMATEEKVTSLGGRFCYDDRFVDSISNGIPCAVVRDSESNNVIFYLTNINF